MCELDGSVARVLDAHHQSVINDDEDGDAVLLALENDDSVLSAFREQRLQQLHAELARAKQQQTEGFGTYVELKEEKPLMDMTTSTKYAVVHFFKPVFAGCAVM